MILISDIYECRMTRFIAGVVKTHHGCCFWIYICTYVQYMHCPKNRRHDCAARRFQSFEKLLTLVVSVRLHSEPRVVRRCVKSCEGLGWCGWKKLGWKHFFGDIFRAMILRWFFSTNEKKVQKDAPKEIPSPTILFWGWDRPILSREGSGFWGCMVFLFQLSLVISLFVDVNSSHP